MTTKSSPSGRTVESLSFVAASFSEQFSSKRDIICDKLFKEAHAAGLIADARLQRLLGGGLF
jgi:hypothetical protein